MPTTDQSAPVLERFPGPVRFYPSRRKWVVTFLGGTAFTAAGAWMVHDGEWLGWLPLGFFALVAIVSFATLLPGAGSLTLDQDGFEAKTLFRSRRARWADVDRFGTVALPPSFQPLVVYDDNALPPGGVAAINIALTSHNSALRDTYGFAADDLAALMTAWRERALRRAGS
jgi:hypothetical protein